MVTALDVEPGRLIGKTAEKLRELGLAKPEFVGLVKSGAHRQRPPAQDGFWYARCASILYQAYTKNVVGANRLRTHYGGRKSRGKRPQRSARAGGSIVRKAMQELERMQLLAKTGGRRVKNRLGKEVLMYSGRRLTPKGRKLLDSAAMEISAG